MVLTVEMICFIFVAGEDLAYAFIHPAADDLPGHSVCCDVHSGLTGPSIPPHPHCASPQVPHALHLFKAGAQMCKYSRKTPYNAYIAPPY